MGSTMKGNKCFGNEKGTPGTDIDYGFYLVPYCFSVTVAMSNAMSHKDHACIHR